MRTKAEVDRFFDGLDVIAPGLVEITTWRAYDWIEYGGVARKPA